MVKIGFISDIPYNISSYKKRDLIVSPITTKIVEVTRIEDLDRYINEFLTCYIKIKSPTDIVYEGPVLKPTEITTLKNQILINGKPVYEDVYWQYEVEILNGLSRELNYVALL